MLSACTIHFMNSSTIVLLQKHRPCHKARCAGPVLFSATDRWQLLRQEHQSLEACPDYVPSYVWKNREIKNPHVKHMINALFYSVLLIIVVATILGDSEISTPLFLIWGIIVWLIFYWIKHHFTVPDCNLCRLVYNELLCNNAI